MRTIFTTPIRSQARANKISIRSPDTFRRSIAALKKGRYTLGDYRALILAQNRARAQLRRRGLSAKERMQFSEIVRIRIPKPASIKKK